MHGEREREKSEVSFNNAMLVNATINYKFRKFKKSAWYVCAE